MPEAGDHLSGPALERAQHLHCIGLSDVGLVRSRNEDALWVDAERGWLLLADGMGGYRGGDVAATLAVSHVLNRLQHDARAADGNSAGVDVLREGIEEANAAIRCVAAANADLSGMGATVVAALLSPRRIVHANVGDSRLYLLRMGRLEQLTRDHTVLQEQVDSGLMDPDEARRLPYRGLLTRGLGVAPEVLPDVGVHELVEADRLLLCSDGLTDMLDETEIAALLGEGDVPAAVAQRLIDAANDRGGRDNVSVIVAWFVA
ncbi:MAG: protein phosphatase 2C domain-containing protein [Azoarcus sp.]|nr:protein phosphatase 2C domain-containing protein [Azoarcus sp.]